MFELPATVVARLEAFLDACIEERKALADLHRANAKRAEAPPFTVPAPANEPEKSEFFACSHRATEAFFAETTLAETVACPFHNLPPGETCPGEPEEDLKDAFAPTGT